MATIELEDVVELVLAEPDEILRSIAKRLDQRLLDERTLGSGDVFTIFETARLAGYRAGWNDAMRALRAELENYADAIRLSGRPTHAEVED